MPRRVPKDRAHFKSQMQSTPTTNRELCVNDLVIFDVDALSSLTANAHFFLLSRPRLWRILRGKITCYGLYCAGE